MLSAILVMIHSYIKLYLLFAASSIFRL